MELQNVRKKRKISKPSREEKNNLPVPQEVPSVKLSIAIWIARRQRSNVFEILRENYFQPRILCPVKLSMKNENNVKIFTDM